MISDTVRVSVVGEARRLDVVVSAWTAIGELAEVYMTETGASAVELMSVAGSSFDPAASLRDAGLRDGSLLIVTKRAGRRARSMPVEPSTVMSIDALRAGLSGTEMPPAPTPSDVARGAGRRALRPDHADDSSPPPAIGSTLPASAQPAAVVVLSLGVTVTALLADSSVRPWAPIALVLLALLTAVLARGHRRSDAFWLATVPLHAAGAAVLVLPENAPTLLSIGVGALVAAAVAASMRTSTPEVADDELITWVIGGGVVALIATICQLAGWSTTTFYASVVIAAIVGTRAIPAYAVRVPDHVLLDVDRLAVTAWTAREKPRRSFRGVVRRGDVTSVARRGTELVAVGTVACSVAVVAGTMALLLADLPQTRRIGTLLLCLGAGGVLVLSGRTRRDRAARRLQRAAGTVTVVATSLWWVAGLGQTWQVRLIVASLVVGTLSLVAARAASRGWTSVWWARRAEVAETLAGVLVFGSIPLATGLFDWMRLLTSG